jgi:hypothetical protein
MQAHVLLYSFSLAALLPIHIPGSYPMVQNPDANLNEPGSQSSEREQNGLRGQVRSVEEETIYPAHILGDGSQTPEMKRWSKTEYDRDGRIVAIRNRGSSLGGGIYGTEWVTRYLYSPAGLLLKITAGKEGEPPGETINHYDNQGRLESITDSRRPDNSIVFRYDANGRKTKIAIVQPAAYPAGTGAVSSSFAAFFEHPEWVPGLPLPDGGTAITVYDTNDRATEVQLRDPSGTLVSRAFRVYDDRGNVTEEGQTMEDPLKLIPAKVQSDIFSKSGVSAEDLRDQLTRLLGSTGELYSCRYKYDSMGRLAQTISNMFNHAEDRKEASYNDHGDIAREISQSSQTGTGDEQADGIHSSEVLYSYEYDSIGNWTVKKSTSRSLPDGQPRDPTETRRTIEYY